MMSHGSMRSSGHPSGTRSITLERAMPSASQRMPASLATSAQPLESRRPHPLRWSRYILSNRSIT